MVLKVPPNGFPVGDYRNIEALENLRITNSREHQNLRRVDSASAENDFAVCLYLRNLLLLKIFDALGAVFIEQQTQYVGVALDGKISSVQCRAQICGRGAPAPPSPDGQLIRTESLLRVSVKVICERIARFGAGLNES